jgi:hypothetical protein
MRKYHLYILPLVILLISCNMFGQVLETTSTWGDNQQTGETQINATLGQFGVEANVSDSCYIVTPGFQQGEGVLETLPYYNIGEIPSQVVYEDIITTFYVWSEDLGISASLYIEDIQPQISGRLTFESSTGRFSLKPDSEDYGRHLVVFGAHLNGDTVFQEVYFDFVPRLEAEQTVFGLTPARPVPAPDDLAFVSIEERDGWAAIAGKKVIFDESIDNYFSSFLEGISDSEEVEFYAEELIIQSPLNLPGTNVTIYAKSLIFGENGYIDTKPETDALANSGDGRKGKDGGNFEVYIGRIDAPPGKRFRAFGAIGQQSPQGIGGDGGDGGDFISNLNLNRFVDHGGGPGGEGKDGRSFGTKGQSGRQEFTGRLNQWVHPHFIRAVLAHLDAAYLNNHFNFTKTTIESYLKTLKQYRNSEEWDSVDNVIQMELNQLGGEMAETLNQIANHHDYFGNPAGWVPMLSFELNRIAFEAEIDPALRILYLAYVLEKKDLSRDEQIIALQNLRDQLSDEIPILEAEFIATLNELEGLEPRVEDIAIDIENISADIQKLEEELIDRAQYLVEERHKPKKKSLWRRIAKTVGTVAKVLPIPGAQPALAAVGEGLSAISKIDFGNFSITETPGQIVGAIDDVTAVLDQKKYKENAQAFIDVIKELDKDSIKQFKFPDFTPVVNIAESIYTSVDELRAEVGETEAPIEEIRVELERLKAESPEFKDLVNRVENLMEVKTAIFVEIQEANAKTTALTSQIQQSLLTISGANEEISAEARLKDLRTSLYVKEMAQRARKRLIKYHYNLARAYEYRLLRPYPNEIDLPGVFDRLVQLMDGFSQNDMLTEAEFNILRAVYDDALAEVTVNILDIYNTNAAERSTPVEFNLSGEDLATLNAGRSVNLNLFRRGFIPVYEIGPRILEFEVIEVVASQEGPTPQEINNVDFRFEHSGITRLTSSANQHDEGQIYLFNHYAPGNSNPIIWEARYDVESNLITPKSPSASSESLLRSLLQLGNVDTGNPENLLLYSRPGAWADIRVTKNDNNDSGARMILEKVRIRVVYDYYSVSDDLTAVEVVTNNNMLPYISLNKADNFQRKDGWGDFRRTYPRTRNGELSLSAPLEYGVWEFVEWTDFFDQPLSQNNEITISLNEDQMLKANYRLVQPELGIPNDTIWISGEEGIEETEILNVGGGELNWTVSTSSPWLTIIDGAEGVNNGRTLIAFEDNSVGEIRTAYLNVIAPESIEFRDTIVVMQSPRTTRSNDLWRKETLVQKYYPNPTMEALNLELHEILVGGQLTIIDVNGTVGESLKITSSLMTVSLSDYAPGIYLIVLGKGETRRTLRIVKY